MAEYGPLALEAQNFLNLLHDPDASELIEDLRIWQDDPKEVYEIIETIVSMRSRHFSIEDEKDEANELYGFCAGIACDNSITPLEVEALLAKIDGCSRLKTDRRIINLRDTACRSIADGQITPEEAEDICGWITRIVGDSASDTGIATFGNVPVFEGVLQDHADIIFQRAHVRSHREICTWAKKID